MTTSTWIETGTLSTGDEIGGDAQAGECYSRRFTNPALPGARVDAHWYVIGPDARGREIGWPHPHFAVQRAATYQYAQDPARLAAGDPQWEEPVYAGDPEPARYPDQDAAEAGARALAAAFDPAAFTWDGRPGIDRLTAYPR